MSTTKTGAKAYQQFIGGEWAGAAGGRSFEDLDPFTGDGGYGRFGGRAVIDEFTEVRWITVQSGSHPFPF